jgi:hypothetical protein
MWMQKGMEVEDIEKIYSYPNSIPAANLQLAMRKSDTELQQRVIEEYSY